VPRSNARAVGILIVARVVIEAIAFACLLALAQAFTGGAAPLDLIVATAAVAGVSCVALAVLRERATEERGRAIVAITLIASVALATGLPAHALDAVTWLGRIILFAILGEVYLWRILSIGRGAVRWADARNAAPFAAVSIALAATLPLSLDRTPLPALSVALVGACAVSLSLARASEELSLARPEDPHSTKLQYVTSVLFGLGVAGLIVALLTPLVEQLLGALGPTLGMTWDGVIFLILLPLGYLAAAVVMLLEPLLRRIDLSWIQRSIPQRSPEEEQAMLREIERNRPLVVGGFELVVVLAVLVIALVLLERVVRDRRLTLAEGGELERGSAAGLSLGETLRGLLPRRPRRRRPPPDDGSPAAALRVVYWRLLALADRAGHGWRDQGETPDEHQRRVALSDPRWSAAEPIVIAFDELRYGDRDPDRTTLSRARAALATLESAVRT